MTEQTIEQGGRIHRDCPSCNAPSASAAPVRYQHPDWPMKQCAACGLVYLEYVPAYDALYDEIAWHKQHKKEEERRLKAMPIMARIDLATRWRLNILGDATVAGGLNAWAKRGPVLDVGCASGKGFDDLKADLIPYGIEIDSRIAEIARAKFEPRGGKLVHADGVGGLKQLPDNFFTGVTLWSYLEHEANPREALEQVRRVVRDDAVVLIKVPNFACWNRHVLGKNWSGFRHPDHVQYFTPSTLGAMAERAGFSAHFRLYGRIPTNDNMYATLRPA
jgi:SAM-dependent methyltransferase